MESVREKDSGSGDSSDSNDQAAITSTSCSSHRSHNHHYCHSPHLTEEEGVQSTPSGTTSRWTIFDKSLFPSSFPCAQSTSVSSTTSSKLVNNINWIWGRLRGEDCSSHAVPVMMMTRSRRKTSSSTNTTSGCVIIKWSLPRIQHFIMLFLLAALTVSPRIPVAESARFPPTLQSAGGQHHENGIHYTTAGDDNMLHSKHCTHVYPKPHEIIHGAFIEPHHVMKKRSIDQPLRIVLYYDESVHKLDQEKKELINYTVLPEAIQYWQQALKVRRTERSIVLNRRCPNQQVYYKADDPHPYCKVECEAKTMCGEVQVPEEHLDVCRVCNENGTNCRVASNSTAGAGIAEADFVFYVSALQTHRCKHGFTVAYAAHCQQESALDRPIAGHANLCPKSISTKPQELDTLISTVKHEILHALGFSVSLYAFYRDDSGNPLTPRDNKGKPPLNAEMQARQWSDRVIKMVERKDWKVREGNITRKMQMIVTPRVVQEVRRHFNCPDLEGAELEDQGEEGTALTHWEKRIFENEAMTGTHTQNPVYSRITLALMEDTGWYRANYNKAQDLNWGHQLGCDFAKKSCMEWMSAAKARGEDPVPYCNKVKAEPLETQCTDDHNSVALCNLVRYTSSLPMEYQNFDWLPNVPNENVTFYGGSVTLADYCPYVQEFTWRANSVVIRGSHCFYDENNPEPDKNFALEEYGDGSRCFYHTKEMWEERSCHQKRHWQHWGSGCYKYHCEDGLLHILVTNRTFTCSYTGQEIKIQLLANGWLHRGGIKCPSCESFCNDCSGVASSYELNNDEFPQDNLQCSSSNQKSSASVSLLISLPILSLFTLKPISFLF
ncbi:unnamed protein product [Orchesella dallaii]|uniref:Leishmanolysin-like peptidase n=1 Tax=Orchesella dallaii TaxID=48710 RepID=A0ABP1R5N9_9HEXA